MLQRRLRQLDARQRVRVGVGLFLVGLLTFIVGVWFNHYANFPATERVTVPAEEVIGQAKGGRIDIGDGEIRRLAATPAEAGDADVVQVDVHVDVDYFGFVPRGCLAGNSSSLVSTAPLIGVSGAEWCLPWFTVGHLVALVGSQLMLAGVAIALILGRKMTWALAAFAGFLTFTELILLLGTLPSEWLNLAQGPLGWTEQNVAFPRENHWPWLVDTWNAIMLNNNVSISWGFLKDFISINLNMAFLTAIIVFAYKVQDWGKPLPEEEAPEAPVSPYGRPLVKAVD